MTMKQQFFSLSFFKVLAVFGVLLICCGIGGWVYTYRIDHRTAPSLSAYCDIDFKTARDVRSQVSSATLSILDHRYAQVSLSPRLRLYIDGIAWDIDGIVRQTPPTYTLSPFDKNTSFKNTSKLFLEIPLEVLPDIKAAKELRVQLHYTDDTAIDLPLNPPDLAYWQEQLK